MNLVDDLDEAGASMVAIDMFADSHIIDGMPVICIFRDDHLIDSDMPGQVVSRARLTTLIEDLVLDVNAETAIDGRIWTVADVKRRKTTITHYLERYTA